MNKDRCGGMEFIATTKFGKDEELKKLWEVQHKKYCSFIGRIRLLVKYPNYPSWKYLLTNWKCKGWHFVKCPDCKKD